MSLRCRGRTSRVQAQGRGSLVGRALACWVLCVCASLAASPALAEPGDAITIEWRAADGDVDAYEVRVSINGGDMTVYSETAGLDEVVSGTLFQRGDLLHFEIVALAADGRRSPPSPLSEPIVFPTLPAPQGLIAVDGDPLDPIVLAWDAVEYAQVYLVFRSTQPLVPEEFLDLQPRPGATSTTDEPELGVPFYYTVAAIQNGQASDFSDPVMAVRRNSPPFLVASPSQLVYTASPGEVSATQTVVLSNAGDWKLTYSTWVGARWLRGSPYAGEIDGQPSTLVLTYDLASLGPGSHSAAVRLNYDFRPIPGEAPTPTSSLTIDVRVDVPNRAPVIESPLSVTIAEGEVLAVPVRATDPDVGDAVVIGVTQLPAFASFDALGGGEGLLTLAPDFDAAGVHTVLLSASDNGSPPGIVNAVLTITVEDTNRAPVVAVIPDTGAQVGETTTLLVSAWDPDLGDRLALTATGLPAFASFLDLGNGTGEFSFTPASSADVGTYLIVVGVVDDGSPPGFVGTAFELTVSE